MSRTVRVFCLYIILPLGTFFHSCSSNQKKEESKSVKDDSVIQREEEPLAEPDSLHLQAIEAGDIILKKGRGPLSKMITEAMHESVAISHCGVFVEREGRLWIVHSVSKRYGAQDGVQFAEVNDFLKDCVKGHTYIMRYRGSIELRKQIATRAMAYAGRGIPFDVEANNADSSAMSCAEVLYHSMNHLEDIKWKTIPVGRTEWLGFSSFLDSMKFKELQRL